MKLKKLISIVLAMMFVLSLLPATVLAENEPTITVQSVSGVPGTTVDVSIQVKNNPGVLGATLKVTYDSSLTLQSATSGSAFSHLTMTKPGELSSPCNFVWDGQDLNSEDIKDGEILSLKFLVKEGVSANTQCKVNVSYSNGDIVNGSLKPLNFDVVNGSITVIDYKPGDLNSDTKVNSTDIIMLRRHIAGKYAQTVNEPAGDVNADGTHNSTDIIMLRRYIADGCQTKPTGYNVELLPGKPSCNHNLELVKEYKAPTCTEDGNIAYWHCTQCDKYFSDENGVSEVTLENSYIPAMGHTVVIDPAVAATYDTEGLTEGSHCSVCNAIITPQEVVPILQKDEYAITYHISDNDAYLQTIEINNTNPAKYTKEDGLVLTDLVVEGYSFLGWYTTQTGGTRISKINIGETGTKTLWARWEKIQYTVQFKCDMVPQADMVYTVGVERVLPTPVMDTYKFVGWTDINGKKWDKIPAGTTGDLVLYANWASERNKAVPVSKLGDPIICEDSENGLILFTYEIGEIQNVPLYTISSILTANGVQTLQTTTTSGTISTENASSIAKSISNATTNSTSWTLANGWEDVTSVSEAYCEEHGVTQEEAETIAKSSTGTYCVGSSSSGKETTITSTNDAHKISANNSGSHTDSTTDAASVDLHVDASLSAQYGPAAARVSGELSAGLATNNSTSVTNSGTSGWYITADDSHDSSTSTTNDKSWNSSSSYTNSKTTSQSNTISNTISDLISKQYGYGSSYSKNGSNSESQAQSSSASSNNEYGSTITYYTSEIQNQTTSYQTSGNTHGYYRIVEAGTVHVFAVVCYDIAKGEYYVYTYNVLGDGLKDDGPKPYLDYSYNTNNFDDYETSILPFEVPIEVNEQVDARLLKTEGLKIDADTGIIESYTPNSENPETIVHIPSYFVIANGKDKDGNTIYKSVKVKGIKEGLFKNNENIKAVSLGLFIDEIPDSAFEGCSSLEYLNINSPALTRIGNNAFAGCVSLKPFSVPETVTELGENAFENASEIAVYSADANVAQSAANSGAKNVRIDISLIPDDENANMVFEIGKITSFELQGGDKEYKGLSIKSDANTTVVNGITFTENNKLPMELSSENVTLDRVTVDCNGFALVLKNEDTNLILNRTVNLISSSENGVICKNAILSELDTNIVGKLNVKGNVLVCGEIDDNGMLTVNNGNIIYINADDFENYLSSHKIAFDANGGNDVTDVKTVPLNTAIGELPIATRDYYTFDGWYTQSVGGEKVTAETITTSLTDITLYAHWIENEVSAWTLKSEVPQDAQIVGDSKYSFTLTSYTSSSSSSLSGWTKYDTQRTGWGSTQGPVYSNPSGSGRNVWSESYVSSTTTHYCYYHRKISGGWGSDSTAPNSPRHTCDLTYELSYKYTISGYGIKCYGDYTCPECGAVHMWIPDGTWDENHYSTRWYYQEPVYTYYYKKTENKSLEPYPTYNLLSTVNEANHPTGTYVSNIKEYVQYRTK